MWGRAGTCYELRVWNEPSFDNGVGMRDRESGSVLFCLGFVLRSVRIWECGIEFGGSMLPLNLRSTSFGGDTMLRCIHHLFLLSHILASF